MKNKDWKIEIARIFREGTSGEIENEDGEKTSWSFEFPDEQYTELLRLISTLLEEAKEEGRKDGDIASDFLYWHPLGGGMPDSSIRIGVEFEVGGCYENWGFVIEQHGRTISSGRTLKEAINKLTTN